jgi:AcrR family transcriptional regulator
MAAAEDLLSKHEPAEVSIERVAAAAGVAKATVFHRFGSRAELMQALAHERTEELRQATLTGPPPLGPGAPPRERLNAFLDALVDHASRSISLLTAQEHAALTSKAGAPARQDHPIYLFWHGHIAEQIRAARPDLDAGLLAHILLGALHGGPIGRLLREGEAGRVGQSMRQLTTALLSSSSVPNDP